MKNKSKSRLWISFAKLILNFVFIYLVTKAIEFISQSLDFYIPFEFTFLIILILYFVLSHFLKIKTFGNWLFSSIPKYQNYFAVFIILLVLMFLVNEILGFKKVYDIASNYSKYSYSEPDYKNRDSINLVDISSIDTSKINNYIAWLNENGKSPKEYILEKISQHQVIVFGEVHQLSNYLVFLNNSIPDLYKSGIRIIAMEVCQKSDNQLLEKLVTSKEYNNQLALEIARHQPWLSWGFKDYWDVLKAVWSFNRNLNPNQEKIKVIGLECMTDTPSFSLVLNSDDGRPSPFYEKFRFLRTIRTLPNIGYREELMAKEIEDQIITKNKKGIVWVGSAHSYLNFKQPFAQKGRMSYILHKKYGDKIFQIFLHFNDYSQLIANFLETVIHKSKLKQIGFDVISSPFAEIRDSSDDNFKNRSMIDFADIARGYIYIVPIDSLVHCKFISNFVSEKIFIKEKTFFEAVAGKSFNNVDELNKFYVIKYN
jgi:hypothetical protein